MGKRIDGHERWRDLLRFRPRVFVPPVIVALIVIDSSVYYLLEAPEAKGTGHDLGTFVFGLVVSVLVAASIVVKLWGLQDQYDGKVHLRFPLSAAEADRCMEGFLSRFGGGGEELVFPEGHEHLLFCDESYEIMVDGHPLLVETYEVEDNLEVFVGPTPMEADPWFFEFVAFLDKALDSCQTEN